ncbi:MAG TPA: hypothetical protein VED40_13460 [Azospirillaceae bacterium]|nr:hypothetical protein [Azospirillaceae bacterium]
MRLPLLAAVLLLAGPALAQEQQPPLTAETLQRYGAACTESKQANAGKPKTMESLRGQDLDAIPKKHGFTGIDEVMKIGNRVMFVDMYADADAEQLKALEQQADPMMKAMIAQAMVDAPVVKANKASVDACKAG